MEGKEMARAMVMMNLLKAKVLKKKRGSKELMIELGLAIVGVVLLIVFREQISTLLQTLGTFVTEKIKGLFSGM
jgi:hypothetical protein